jgi:hypothetical protein
MVKFLPAAVETRIFFLSVAEGVLLEKMHLVLCTPNQDGFLKTGCPKTAKLRQNAYNDHRLLYEFLIYR